jgi:hypothetical protein
VLEKTLFDKVVKQTKMNTSNQKLENGLSEILWKSIEFDHNEHLLSDQNQFRDKQPIFDYSMYEEYEDYEEPLQTPSPDEELEVISCLSELPKVLSEDQLSYIGNTSGSQM